MKWIHRLFNPHCPHCIQETDILRAENELLDTCKTCESHIREINFLRQQVKDLQDHILHPSISVEPTINTDELKPLNPLRESFSVIRSRLEKEDRLKAKQIDEQLLANKAAKLDPSPIVNDEGKVDINLVERELENMNKEIAQNG